MAEGPLPDEGTLDQLLSTLTPEEADRDGTLTAMAPPFRPPAPAAAVPEQLLGLPMAGQRLDDFELLSVLGVGSFAKVFLARQTSLGRLVALKVSLNVGSEARTLASLEHDHIVRVFSEVVDPGHNLRLLCMQYVPGTTLEKVMAALRGPRSGRAILQTIDALSQQPAPLDLAALRDREMLSGCDAVEAGCWLGARLAEALAHAHRLGVLHRDVKPANILLNRYGRPLLADFNVAAGAAREGGASQPLGGTLAYMAPEHLDAFNPEDPTPPEAVDARSDVYSLGVVLFELFAGRLPFKTLEPGRRPAEYFRVLAQRRREEVPTLSECVKVPAALDRVVRRCLDPDPARRYQSADELARALDGCRELCRAQRQLPPGGLLVRLTLARPFLMAALLILLPHLLGSVVNISYNALRIVGGLPAEHQESSDPEEDEDEELLTPAQESAFRRLVVVYNVVVYPLCLVLMLRQVIPVFRTWSRLAGHEPIEPGEVEEARRRALRLPRWAAALSCLGWLPGALVFPLGLDLLAGPVPAEVYEHFLVSFLVSGLIALTYSVLAVQFVVLRVLYPGLWLDGRGLHESAAVELGRVEGRLRLLQFLAVLIPLAGAALLLGVGPNEFDEGTYRTFRLLVTALLGLGMLGLGIALLVSAELSRTVAVLIGERRAGEPGQS
jgi:serine/threonine protein kinase